MEFTVAALGFIFYYILLPLVASAMALIVLGGISTIAILIPYLLMRYGLGAVFAVIDKVPVLGRLIIGAGATVVGIAMTGYIFLVIFLPLCATILSAIAGGGKF